MPDDDTPIPVIDYQSPKRPRGKKFPFRIVAGLVALLFLLLALTIGIDRNSNHRLNVPALVAFLGGFAFCLLAATGMVDKRR